MTKEKKATLLRVLVAVMHTGVLGRIPAHAATKYAKGHGDAATPALARTLPATTNDVSFDLAFNQQYVQSFGDLFVLEEPWFEASFPTW